MLSAVDGDSWNEILNYAYKCKTYDCYIDKEKERFSRVYDYYIFNYELFHFSSVFKDINNLNQALKKAFDKVENKLIKAPIGGNYFLDDVFINHLSSLSNYQAYKYAWKHFGFPRIMESLTIEPPSKSTYNQYNFKEINQFVKNDPKSLKLQNYFFEANPDLKNEWGDNASEYFFNLLTNHIIEFHKLNEEI